MKRFPGFLLLFFSFSVLAQNVPIGQWKCYLPYGAPLAVADAGDRVFCANASSLFSYNKTDHSFDRMSKATGLSDIGVRNVLYDPGRKTLVVLYTNSNIDFIIDSALYNFPFIKSANIGGDKNVYDAAFDGDTVILSCGFGIVLFNLSKLESPATYYFTNAEGAYIPVHSCAAFGNAIYAATDSGLYKGDLGNSLLEDFGNWHRINAGDGLPDGGVQAVRGFGASLYAFQGDSVFSSSGDSWDLFFYDPGWENVHLSAGNGHVLFTQHYGDGSPADSARIISINADNQVSVVQPPGGLPYPVQANIDAGGVYWIADQFDGLVSVQDNEISGKYVPNGPGSTKVTNMAVNSKNVWVAPGEINSSWNYLYNRDGFFLKDEYGTWFNANRFSYPAFDTTFDLIRVCADPDGNRAYFGSFGGGLLEFNKAEASLQIYKQNSGPDGLQPPTADPNSYRIAGLALDQDHNLWISNYGAPRPLVVKKSDGTWRSFNPEPGIALSNGNQLSDMVIDPNNTIWIRLARGGGILVFNDNGTVDDESDDLHRVLNTGAGYGNLPTSYVNCLAVDKDGEIWAGTNEGVAIFYNPASVFETGSTAGDATQPLVNLGGYYEQLLAREIINSIAVDGANRKWVATGSGVFLISADGTQQLLYFNQDNSPLLSDVVLTVAIDGSNGDVYFGTDKGICSYRYTATDGTEKISDVTVFPNPVRENYQGLVAISGLADDAEVRITDASGRMIYKTTALGGQAVWDCKGYGGQRAKTGVYLVYTFSGDGTEKYVAKILVIN